MCPTSRDRGQGATIRLLDSHMGVVLTKVEETNSRAMSPRSAGVLVPIATGVEQKHLSQGRPWVAQMRRSQQDPAHAA